MPREIENLDIKVKLLREYLINGGVEKIKNNPELVYDLFNIKSDADDKVNPDTITPRVNAFMLAILGSHSVPPVFVESQKSEYKSTLQKSLCFDQINIDTEEQFDAIYEEFKNKTDFLFRGQGEAKWRLYSTLQRKLIEDKLLDTELSYQEFLIKLVENGKAKYETEIQDILNAYHIDATNDVSVLSYLQHHKCQTPLLDWTYSFGNSFFFALEGITNSEPKREIDEYFSVYYLEEEQFEGSNLVKLLSNSFQELSEEMKIAMIEKIAGVDDAKKLEMKERFKNAGFIDYSKIQGIGFLEEQAKTNKLFQFPCPIIYFSDSNQDANFIFSVSNNANIKNQQGVFMFNSSPTKPMEMVAEEYYKQTEEAKETPDYAFCNCFDIKKELAGYVLAKLEADGITRELIYPTADVDASAIYEQSKENK